MYPDLGRQLRMQEALSLLQECRLCCARLDDAAERMAMQRLIDELIIVLRQVMEHARGYR